MRHGLDQARQQIRSGQLSEAEMALKDALQNGADAEASALLGIVFAKTQRLDEAVTVLEKSLQIDPKQTEALLWLASVETFRGRLEQAVGLLGRLHEVRNDNPESFNVLGNCLLRLGRGAEAEAAFRTVIRLARGSAPAYSNLGMALRIQNRGSEALQAFRMAFNLDRQNADNALQLFKQYQQLARMEEGIEALLEGLKQNPSSIALAEALAMSYGRMNEGEKAEQIFREISSRSALAANSYALWLQDLGRFEDSVAVLQRSTEIQPKQGEAYRSLVEAGQTVLQGRRIREIAEALFNELGADATSQMHLAFALGKLYDREQDYGSAMRWLDSANTLAYRLHPVCRTFDAEWMAWKPKFIAGLFTEETFNRIAEDGNDDPRPIFIVGMIRSGTTLLDQIVSSHPSVVSVGECTFWNAESEELHRSWQNRLPDEKELHSLAERYLRAVGSPKGRFTDKMPLNFRNLGPIHAAFPKAKILHIRRDPFDTCLSIYSNFFGGGSNFAYSQQNIVTFYLAYLAYMEHWRNVLPSDQFYELDYEDLVQSPAAVIRGVIEFLGLPWDDTCLTPEQNQALIPTPSRWQARQPIHTQSVGRRNRYAPYAGDLLKCPPSSRTPK